MDLLHTKAVDPTRFKACNVPIEDAEAPLNCQSLQRPSLRDRWEPLN